MCRPADCPNCHHTAWIGCGLHIEAAMASEPKSAWCVCLHPENSQFPRDFPPRAGTGIESH